MQRHVRAGWIAVGAVLTVVAVLAAPVAAWPLLTSVHGSSYASSPLPDYRETHTVQRAFTITAPDLRIDASGPVDVTILAGRAGRVSVTRELSWSQGQPNFAESWDGHTLEIDFACRDTDRTDVPPCRARYTLVVPGDLPVTAESPDGTVTDRRR
jgi:hypothetical protein